MGSAEVRTLRAGYALSSTPGLSTEQYLFTTARYLAVEARTGIARTDAFSHTATRWRLAVGVHVDRYYAAIAREAGKPLVLEEFGLRERAIDGRGGLVLVVRWESRPLCSLPMARMCWQLALVRRVPTSTRPCGWLSS